MSDRATEVPTNVFLELGQTIQDSARTLSGLYKASEVSLQKVMVDYAIDRLKVTFGSLAVCRDEINEVCKILQDEKSLIRIARLYEESESNTLGSVLSKFRQTFGIDIPTAKLLYNLWHHIDDCDIPMPASE